MATVVATLIATKSPALILASIAGILILVVGIKMGKERAVGVGIVGAIASVIFLAPNLFPSYVGMALGVGWLAVFVLIANRRTRRSGPLVLFGAVFLIGIVGAILSPTFPLFSVLVAVFILILASASISMNYTDRMVFRKGIVLLACLEAIICLLETFVLRRLIIGELPGWPHPMLTDGIRAVGTLGHPIVAGVVMLLGLTVVVVFRPWTPTVRGAQVLILLAGIFAAGSSSVWAVSVVVLLYGFATRGGLGARTFKSILVAAIGLYILSDPPLIADATSDLTGENAAHRINSIVAAPSLVTDRPLIQALLGSGWGSAEKNYLSGYLVNVNFFAVDNQFTTILMATGVIGFTLFVAFLITMFKRTTKTSLMPILALTVMFFSFDVLGWAATGAMFVVFCSELLHRESAQVSPNPLRQGLSKVRGKQNMPRPHSRRPSGSPCINSGPLQKTTIH